jgi:excinuclease UvrABC nuclease subunit
LEKEDDSLLRDREIRHSSFYFEKGTKDVLEQFVTFRNRNTVIERFILEEYKPSHNRASILDKPNEPESMRISISAEAFLKLDHYVKEIQTKGISRTALMRDVVEQLITKLSKTDARQLIAEKRLQKALSEYKNVFGQEELKERLEQYKINKIEQE